MAWFDLIHINHVPPSAQELMGGPGGLLALTRAVVSLRRVWAARAMFDPDFSSTVRAQDNALGIAHMIIDFLENSNSSWEILAIALLDQNIHKTMGTLPGNNWLFHVTKLFLLSLGQVLFGTSRHRGAWTCGYHVRSA